ncbi:MAG: DUF262 domain-containing protein [Acidobacteria bacterium]|nr:DUF262 domain-containing protein [Acidobacteriota bacterium]
MSLENEIQQARKEIVADGYEMSIGELINLYKENELIINPDFQRLFRWDSLRRTRFIESLLLGIPIPPIFVFQNENAIWELIDGLQRLSTVFEFVGILKKSEGGEYPASVLEGTKFLPSLSNKRWEPSSDNSKDGIGKSLQLQIKRARMRVEILKQESDPQTKYELFQRLNTGGAALSEQEVRNCVAAMINKPFYQWLRECALNKDFLKTIDQTDTAIEKQAEIELVLRFFSFRIFRYNGKDVHEYLDDAMGYLATTPLPFDTEKQVFERTFQILNMALEDKAFKKWTGKDFEGKFLMSVFEVIAIGVSKNLDSLESLSPDKQKEFICKKAKELWDNPTFQKNSGAGIRGTTRLSKLLPLAEGFLRP